MVARLDEAFVLSGRRRLAPCALYAGHKSVVEALRDAPAPLAMRFGVPVFDLLVRWGASRDPLLRETLAAAVQGKRLTGRFAPEVERVRGSLQASQAAPRNPDHDFGPSRNRGGTRTRKRYR